MENRVDFIEDLLHVEEDFICFDTIGECYTTNSEFKFWLSGFLENKRTLNENEIELIKDKLIKSIKKTKD